MGDDADRAYLSGLTELERESILSERAERRETEVARRRTLRQRAIAAGTYKPSSRSAADDERAAAEAAARGPASKKAQQRSALQDLKAQRAARAAGGGGGGAAASAAAAAAARAREERDDDDEEFEVMGGASDEDEDDIRGRRGGDGGGRRRSRGGGGGDDEEDEDAEYPDVVKAQLRRSTLEKWADEPFLPRYAPGCTVRVALNGKYLAAEVSAVASRPHGTYTEPGLPPTPCPYRLGGGAAPSPSASALSSRQRPTMTDRWLEISRCGRRRLVPFTIVSNQAIAEAELEEWERLQSAQGFQPYSRAQARGAAEGLRAAAAYKYTEADVSAMIAAKKRAAAAAAAAGRDSPAGGAPSALAGVTNVAAERARLIAARDFAFAAGDKEAALAASRDLEALAAADAAARARRDAGGRDAALAALNERNARRNVANSLVDVGTGVADAAADAAAAAAEAAELVSPDGRGAAAAAAALSSSAKVRIFSPLFCSLFSFFFGARGEREGTDSEELSCPPLRARERERERESEAAARGRAGRRCQGGGREEGKYLEKSPVASSDFFPPKKRTFSSTTPLTTPPSPPPSGRRPLPEARDAAQAHVGDEREPQQGGRRRDRRRRDRESRAGDRRGGGGRGRRGRR